MYLVWSSIATMTENNNNSPRRQDSFSGTHHFLTMDIRNYVNTKCLSTIKASFYSTHISQCMAWMATHVKFHPTILCSAQLSSHFLLLSTALYASIDPESTSWQSIKFATWNERFILCSYQPKKSSWSFKKFCSTKWRTTRQLWLVGRNNQSSHGMENTILSSDTRHFQTRRSIMS